MRAGRMRHVGIFQRSVERRTDHGDYEDQWVLLFRQRVAVLPMSGRQLTNAMQMHEQVTYRVRTRYRDGVDATCRIIIVKPGQENRVLYITNAINVSERDRELELLCTERMTDG